MKYNYGIIGKKGSGKSFLSSQMLQASGLSGNPLKFSGEVTAKNLKMADTLKDMIRVMLSNLDYKYGIVEEMIEGTRKTEIVPELGVTPRHLMQTLGTEWGRNCVNESVWGDIFEYRFNTEVKSGYNIICDDVRFENEVARCKRLDMKLIKIKTEDEDNSDSHPSEQMPSDRVADVIWLNDKENGFVDLCLLETTLNTTENTKIVVVLDGYITFVPRPVLDMDYDSWKEYVRKHTGGN